MVSTIFLTKPQRRFHLPHSFLGMATLFSPCCFSSFFWYRFFASDCFSPLPFDNKYLRFLLPLEYLYCSLQVNYTCPISVYFSIIPISERHPSRVFLGFSISSAFAIPLSRFLSNLFHEHLSFHWSEHLPVLRSFVSWPSQAWYLGRTLSRCQFLSYS